jgi:hypothetical protein
VLEPPLAQSSKSFLLRFFKKEALTSLTCRAPRGLEFLDFAYIFPDTAGAIAPLRSRPPLRERYSFENGFFDCPIVLMPMRMLGRKITSRWRP